MTAIVWTNTFPLTGNKTSKLNKNSNFDGAWSVCRLNVPPVSPRSGRFQLKYFGPLLANLVLLVSYLCQYVRVVARQWPNDVRHSNVTVLDLRGDSFQRDGELKELELAITSLSRKVCICNISRFRRFDFHEDWVVVSTCWINHFL